MRMSMRLGVVILALSPLGGCTTYVVYESQKEFEYRVANLETVPAASLPDGGPGGTGGGSSAVSFERLSDGRVRITPPAGTMSLGVATATPRPASATLRLQGESDERSVPVPEPVHDQPSFMGVVSHKPIASLVTPGPIRSVQYERR